MQKDALRGTPLGFLCLCLSLDQQKADDIARVMTGAELDWPQLLRAAGNHLVTPSLTSALERLQILQRLDSEIHDYLDGVRNLNLSRNDVLRRELFSIVRELNSIGITPLLIKGAATLLPSQYPRATDRIIGDLDIVVPDERIRDARGQLVKMGYSYNADAWLWATAAEKRSKHHIPRMMHPSLSVSVELHRRMISDPTDDLALRNGGKCQSLVMDDGTNVLVQDPASRLVQSYIHSQISHELGIRRLINLRHLHEFACLAEFNKSDITQEAIFDCIQPRRRDALLEYWAIAEDWLGALRPEGIAQSPGECSTMQFTERAMTNKNWRKVFAIWADLASLPRRLVGFGLRIWEKPDYLPIRIRRFWMGG